ncbi:hypothetical protein [Mesorhizobium huakuii]|uniref:hypothetical protein n=1 Tax=Mesorhizobium huakuii TaxID=28104 RepID=UPI001FD34664|nr:hypothetical protein [Mesorhizobium huakuii]
MLEKYYIRPATIDRIQGSWIASTVEQYGGWMAERRYTDRSVSRRIPIVVSFGEFAKAQGASERTYLITSSHSCKRGLVSMLDDARAGDASRSAMNYAIPSARC